MNKVESLLILDFRKKENKKKIKSMLIKTKWFKRFNIEDINIEVLEQGYRKVIEKYPALISYVHQSSRDSWAFNLKRSDNNQWIHTIYCNTLEEGMIKTMIVLYAYFIKGMRFRKEE